MSSSFSKSGECKMYFIYYTRVLITRSDRILLCIQANLFKLTCTDGLILDRILRNIC